MHGGFTAAGFDHAISKAYFNPVTMTDANANNPDGVSGNDGAQEEIISAPALSGMGDSADDSTGHARLGEKRRNVMHYRAPGGSPGGQNGSGATPDTRFAIEDDQTEGSAIGFTLAVAEGGEAWGRKSRAARLRRHLDLLAAVHGDCGRVFDVGQRQSDVRDRRR
jgi:hypothetical protein